MTLSEILSKYPTDKNTLHSYGPVYDALLAPIRDKAEFVLEIGIAGGASIRAWRDYFSKATIVGLDISPHCMIENEDRIITCCGAQDDFHAATAFSRSRGIQYDLIIDDAEHTIEKQVMSLYRSIRS